MTSPQAASLEGASTLGRFELLLPIARGGMAEVWAARSQGTRGFHKLVALKTLHGGASDVRLEDMLLEEARLASLIVHPNVVATHELGEDNGVLYLVMEWVDGLPLSDMLRAADDGRLPLPIAVQLFAQVCRGLHAAHELRDESDQPLGLVHRDISPQNVLVDRRGIAKIVDFGVAKATARDSGLTEEGELKGKVAYMAPEQVSGGAVDRRTDIFALGAVFYLLTTGKHPFRGQTVAETVRNICAGETPAPSSTVEGYPVALDRIITKALSPNPNERHASARELLADLERAFPVWTLPGKELAVKDYVEATVGGVLAKRRERLKRAQEERDRTGHGSGTMRAFTLNSRPGEDSSSAISGAPEVSSGTGSQELTVSFQPRTFPLKMAAVGALLLCGVIVTQVVLLKSGSSASEASSSAAPVRVPEPKLPTTPAPSQASMVSNETILEATAPEESPRRSQDEPKPQRRFSVKAKPPPPKAWKPPPPPSTSAVPAPLPAKSDSAPEVDAWDPDTFGDRH